MMFITRHDKLCTDDAIYYIGERIKGRRKDGVCTREWKCMTAEVLMATPCTNSLGGGSERSA